jgi:hypothetical protein
MRAGQALGCEELLIREPESEFCEWSIQGQRKSKDKSKSRNGVRQYTWGLLDTCEYSTGAASDGDAYIICTPFSILVSCLPRIADLHPRNIRLLGHLDALEKGASKEQGSSMSMSSSSYSSIIDVASKQDDFLWNLSQNKEIPLWVALHELVSESKRNAPAYGFTPSIWRQSPAFEYPTRQPISSAIVLNSHRNELRRIEAVSGLLRLPLMLTRYLVEFKTLVEFSTATYPQRSFLLDWKI